MDWYKLFQDYVGFGLLAVLVGSAVFGAVIWHKINCFIRNRGVKQKFKRGQQGEEQARLFLEQHGYSILEEQSRLDARMWVDGEAVDYFVRADFVVCKEGVKAVVEVKTGAVASNPATIHTRRQLFEYTHLYQVDEVLFFDAEARELKKIAFDECASEGVVDKNAWPVFWSGVAFGSAAMLGIGGCVWWLLRKSFL